MSDHISGPRALAEPIADITDVYAFPSPEHPGHLVMVMNTMPFAQPSDAFSEGLVYRLRIRTLTSQTVRRAAVHVRHRRAHPRLRVLRAVDSGRPREPGGIVHRLLRG